MHKYIFTLFYMIPTIFCCAQSPSHDVKYKIDSIISPYIKQYSIVGMSVGMVHGANSYTLQYGQTSHNNGYPVTDQTMFHIASITKLFTATAIMQLVEKGKISLDDKIIKIIPEFRLRSKNYTQITIKQLLNHTSGLPWVNKQNNLPEDGTSVPLFLKGLEGVKLHFKPGAKFSGDTYSNVAFNLLGIVIERISNQSYHEYVYKNILSKLNMDNATYYYEEIDSTVLALPQVVAGNSKKIKRFNNYRIDSKRNPILNGQPLILRDYEVYGEPFIDNAAGNLITTSAELNKWAKYILKLSNHMEDDTINIISKATLFQMWDVTGTIPEYKISMGLTWWIFDNPDLGRYYCHFGNNPGFCAVFFLFPDKNFGINILCNGMFAQEAVFNQIPLEIARLIFHQNKI